MFVPDLYVIQITHWTKDPKPRNGNFRVDMDTILLIAASTATRPQALVESSAAKNSNKALLYEDIQIFRVRDERNWNRTTTIARVDLTNIKGKGRVYRATIRGC
jgi:hypothetical protein